jgi:hypothetical protein
MADEEESMRVTRWKWIIGVGVSLMASVQAHAQPLVARTESIESTVANADLIFIATLVDFRRAEQGHDRDGHEVTIVIEETLKQELFSDEPYRGLSLHVPRPASVLEDWKERSSRLLVAYDEYAPKQTTVIDLSPDKLEAMTAGVELIRDPESVIRLARKAVHRLPRSIKRIHTFDLHVPREIVAETSWDQYYDTGGHLRLSVPVDQHLEKRAQDAVRSENPHRREEGARALAYFKSDKNMALVRPLLNDPGTTYLQPAYDDRAGERVYGVRYSAHQTLKSWGIDVEQPVFREAVR